MEFVNDRERRRKRRFFLGVAAFLSVAMVGMALWLANFYNLLPQKTYTAADFGVETAVSPVDFNQNGLDDYQDFLLGARADAENHPRYDGAYYDGGYPPDDVGVCTDVIWRAFREAGYSLREMVDKDAAARPEAYPGIQVRDSNIDFRRVRNLRVFFESYGVSLSTDPEQIGEWQPGDIVIFGDDKHIGIVSDLRNSRGQTYIVHNGGQPRREEDYLKRGEVTGHYRFDASQVPEELLIPWTEE